MKTTLALLLVLLLGGCAVSPPAATGSEPTAVRFAVAGDSLTSWTNVSFPNPDGDFDERTWLHWALESPELELLGGYAHPGARSGGIIEAIGPVDAEVLVVMAGTNDIGRAPAPEVLDNIEGIVAIVGAETVIVCAIPPRVDLIEEAAELNAGLEARAGDQGWIFIDPWVTARDATGSWSPGATTDGIHTTPESARAASDVITAAMRSAAEQG